MWPGMFATAFWKAASAAARSVWSMRAKATPDQVRPSFPFTRSAASKAASAARVSWKRSANDPRVTSASS